MKEPNLVWGNHKIKNYSRYTKDKENGIKTYYYRESRKRSRDEDRNKGTTKQPENKEQSGSNYIKLQQTYSNLKDTLC